MHRDAKRLLGHGLLDLVLILALLRRSGVLPSWENENIIQNEAVYDDGPLLGIVSSPVHHFQQQPTWGGPGLAQKVIERHYDPIVDEYDRIMRDVQSRPPSVLDNENIAHENLDQNERYEDRSIITMVLSSRSPSWEQNSGGVQIATHNFQSEGAVGGISLPYSADENFDVFQNYIPENMREDEIDELILSETDNSADLSLENTFPDINWQQFIADYDNFVSDARGPLKGINGSFGNWGNFDILNEAVQSAELFLPMVTSSQNSTVIDAVSEQQEEVDIATASRLEVIEYNEWASQNHQADLLFPSLPPPSYEEVMATEETNSSSENVATEELQNLDHMHDHNYFNSSITPPSGETTQSAGYAIRSRHEVSTRVITVPPRSRHVSEDAQSSSSIETGDTVDLTSDLSFVEVTRSSVRRITTSSDGSVEEITEQSSNGHELNLFEIQPLNMSYFENLNKDVSLRREVVLCN